ncbi:hypothetical protein EV188_105247 [Actinomycetospora succinea]|uniref:Uncharacterized protein n=1 Tax=Actinomycetospora succinea TaxID=663603 RepID=A0A4R6V9H3_9PSEU|nr:hypothetical protein [Actinomycetospora succinea]TDQ55849.1 hypothetical protein EV188_105247 [Actinomycetospora succinea]
MSALQVIASVAQTLSPLLYAAFIVVIWFQLRAARESVREVRQEFLAGGRPVVAVHDEFDHASRALSLAVENVGQGPAKNISFTFSRPIESSDGVEISGLPVFTIGLTSLSPGARITCFWDDLDDQMTFLRKNGLDGEDFQVTVCYTDLPGADYWNTWDIQPAVYEGLRPPVRPRQHAHDQAGEVTESGAGAQGSPPEPTGEPAQVAASTGATEGT